MAMAVAGTVAKGETVIERAQAVAVTFPAFVESMKGIGADITVED
jgi:5-enolpyruvylshikimate-3-phosphate synthase